MILILIFNFLIKFMLILIISIAYLKKIITYIIFYRKK
jgi:hypothetical protein